MKAGINAKAWFYSQSFVRESTYSNDHLNAEYQAALTKHNAAIAEYTKAKLAYRRREINDEQFLAAKATYDAATKEFDVAFDRESNR